MFASELAVFAARFNVPVAEAYVLPAVFERVAMSVGMAKGALVAEATYMNPPLGEYLAKVARKVAAMEREG